MIDAIDSYFASEKGKSMEHKYKTFEVKFKSDSDDNGKISGYFSTYDEEPDSYGDIIAPGAFTETIEKRKATGHPFPLCFNHDFDKIIGTVDSIEDTEKGPLIEASFLDTELAQDVRKFVKSGAIFQFSFAYDVLDWELPTKEQQEKGIVSILKKLDVFEISIVTVPANQNAVMTDIKSGRRNSKSDEDIINQIIKLAESLLTKEDGEALNDTEEGEKAIEEEETKVNEASEEPKVEINSKAAAVLEKISEIKETANNES